MKHSSCASLVCLWLGLLLCLIPHLLVAGSLPVYQPRLWNRSCNYTVSNVPAQAFFTRSSTADALFPISPGYRLPVPSESKQRLASVQLSCFGPGQHINQTLVAAGVKMPCSYVVNARGLVDYWEEAVCELAIKSNCYCYAINKQSHRGYCIPGYGSLGTLAVDFNDCSDAVAKVKLDGGKLVTRQEVYSPTPPQTGHYIALVVWPGNDFHFFRRDAEGSWSQKHGDTFVTNTFPNGSIVWDVEDPAILGAYSSFCGYFHVDPATHAETDSSWTYSSVPKRLQQAKDMGYAVSSVPLTQPSSAWMRLNYPYLLFGLDAAVFESGQRRLPWQAKSSGLLEEAGKAGNSSRQASSLPHWTSHAQVGTTVQERDAAIRAEYHRLAAKFALV